MGRREHFREAFRWSSEARAEWADVLVAGLGAAVPVLVGAAFGRLPLGLVAAVGSFTLGGGRRPGNEGEAGHEGRRHLLRLAPGLAAAFAAALASGHGWLSEIAIVLLAVAAALGGGYSRPMAVASTRFIFLLILLTNIAGHGSGGAGGAVLLMAVGALWTEALSTAFAPFRSQASSAASPAEPGRIVTPEQRRRAWQRSLQHWYGWHYALRLGAGLAIGCAAALIWPDDHLDWIAMTVAILTERRIEAFPIRITQRALGAAAGVLASSLLIGLHPTEWLVVAAVFVLAALRPILRAGNYLAYTVVMTPLIILVMDAGRPLAPGVLADRLIATLAGAALVLAGNFAFRRFLPAEALERPTRQPTRAEPAGGDGEPSAAIGL